MLAGFILRLIRLAVCLFGLLTLATHMVAVLDHELTTDLFRIVGSNL
jgi:hypothetical protein